MGLHLTLELLELQKYDRLLAHQGLGFRFLESAKLVKFLAALIFTRKSKTNGPINHRPQANRQNVISDA